MDAIVQQHQLHYSLVQLRLVGILLLLLIASRCLEAVISARKKLVEGAVTMVEMALTQLSEKDVVHLDDERKAAMVSNLMVVLCGERDTQPVVNAGSLY